MKYLTLSVQLCDIATNFTVLFEIFIFIVCIIYNNIIIKCVIHFMEYLLILPVLFANLFNLFCFVINVLLKLQLLSLFL